MADKNPQQTFVEQLRKNIWYSSVLSPSHCDVKTDDADNYTPARFANDQIDATDERVEQYLYLEKLISLGDTMERFQIHPEKVKNMAEDAARLITKYGDFDEQHYEYRFGNARYNASGYISVIEGHSALRHILGEPFYDRIKPASVAEKAPKTISQTERTTQMGLLLPQFWRSQVRMFLSQPIRKIYSHAKELQRIEKMMDSMDKLITDNPDVEWTKDVVAHAINSLQANTPLMYYDTEAKEGPYRKSTPRPFLSDEGIKLLSETLEANSYYAYKYCSDKTQFMGYYHVVDNLHELMEPFITGPVMKGTGSTTYAYVEHSGYDMTLAACEEYKNASTVKSSVARKTLIKTGVLDKEWKLSPDFETRYQSHKKRLADLYNKLSAT